MISAFNYERFGIYKMVQHMSVSQGASKLPVVKDLAEPEFNSLYSKWNNLNAAKTLTACHLNALCRETSTIAL